VAVYAANGKYMLEENRTSGDGIIHKAHRIEFGVKVVVGVATLIGITGSFFAQIYGQLGFGPTVIISAMLALIVTQMPLLVPWGRKNFVMWRSRYPWLPTIFAVVLVTVATFHDWLPRLIRHSVPSDASVLSGDRPLYEGKPLGIAWPTARLVIVNPPIVFGFDVDAKNVGIEEVALKGAYLISGIDSTRIVMLVSAPPLPFISSQTATAPLGADMVFRASFGDITEADFLSRWSTFSIVIEYNETKLHHDF
jgi:hypothetical protein